MCLSKKYYLFVSLFVLFMLVAFLSNLQKIACAEESILTSAIRTVNLAKEPAGISANPLNINLGTTIVWFNQDPEPVTIKFTTKLGLACKAPVNFYSDLFGYYETNQIPQGGTASICFIYEGAYIYEVSRIANKGEEKLLEEISEGKIIVNE